MRDRSVFIFSVFFLLAGCGTLHVDVDYRKSSTASDSETVPAAPDTPTRTPVPTSTLPHTASPTDTVVPPPPRAVDIALGKSHSCAVFDDGRVMCWGNNEHRQLGDGGNTNSSRPVEVAGLADAKALAAGWAHTCALTETGGVTCWGYNKNGELGNGELVDSGIPAAVTGLASGVVAIDAGDDHTCAVKADGSLWCWGFNQYGQLGDGSTTSRSVPVPVRGLAGGAAAVAAGWGHTCALNAEKNIQCWGNDEYGQLGYGQTEDYRFTPMDVAGLERRAERISADGGETCALTIYGGISCWGNNKYGQLGDGTTEVRNTPDTVSGLEQGMRAAAAGWNHTCGVTVDGGLLCWGWNDYGQLGDGTKASRVTPVEVYGFSEGTASVSIGWGHTCAVTETGGVKCWGRNDVGQLGDGTTLDSQAPLTVVGMDGVPFLPETGTPTATPAPFTPTKSGVSATPTEKTR